jgi:hypothetical protein
MACGGSSSGGSGTSTITLVGASCNPTAITSGQTSQCTASVSGTGSFSNTVVWTSSAGGTINSTSGLFTAGNVPFTTQVTITATSTQDASKSGSTTLTVATAGTVTGVTTTCSPSSIQTGQLTQCTATVQGTGNFSPNVDFSASGGTISAITGIFSSALAGSYTITATSQQNQVTGTATVNVAAGVNNQLAIVVDPGPTGNYVNGLFATVTVCQPGTTTCQTIDHVLVDTGSNGLRLIAQGAAGGEFDPTGFPLQLDASNNPIAECNQFVGGVMWGSVSLATIEMAGETASTVPGAAAAAPGVPVQVVGDTRVPAIPSSCSALGSNIGNLTGLNANGVLGVGNFQQDCGPGCVSGSSAPTMYYTCAGGSCATSFLPLPQQVTNPAWALPADNNGVLIQLPSVPSGGTSANVPGNLIFGIGTQLNNTLGAVNVFNTDANAFFTTTFNGIASACSYIDSGSNAYFFPPSGYPPNRLVPCTGNNSSFYCPVDNNGNPTLLVLSAKAQSSPNQTQVPPLNVIADVPFNVGNANTLFTNQNGQNFVFSELGGPNAPINGCGSFAWGAPFFYGKTNGVFTGIEQMPVTGTSYVGPFWAF